MSIQPLPVFEADADPHHRSALTDEEIYDRLEPPKTIVVKFGSMRLVGEYPYDGDAKPGCGSKLVVRTHRGSELAEMLTTTCENAGCSKSVTRKELLSYVDASGGKDYPFHTRGRVLRVATIEDINRHSLLQSERSKYVRSCKKSIDHHGLKMKLVEVEPILGGELLTFYYMSEERIDFRQLVRDLADEFKTRIEMRQVGARDEARLVADYERCGQYCCCKNFLKVLKPVSMKSAKVQKATLDPLKISGRCGRLMCCLRYEDQTYKELKATLPRKGTRVGTDEGPGVVIDGKILVQLVLVRLEADNREVAVPVEDLLDPDDCPSPEDIRARTADPLRGMPAERLKERVEEGDTPPDRRKKRKRRRGRRGKGAEDGTPREGGAAPEPREGTTEGKAPREGRSRRRRKPRPAGDRPAGERPAGERPAEPSGSDRAKGRPQGDGGGGEEGGAKKKRRRRRRRRGKGGDGGGGSGESG